MSLALHTNKWVLVMSISLGLSPTVIGGAQVFDFKSKTSTWSAPQQLMYKVDLLGLSLQVNASAAKPYFPIIFLVFRSKI